VGGVLRRHNSHPYGKLKLGMIGSRGENKMRKAESIACCFARFRRFFLNSRAAAGCRWEKKASALTLPCSIRNYVEYWRW